MAAAPHDGAPPHPDETDAAADGRPFGVPAFYAEYAERLLDDGYEPLPTRPAAKAPFPSRWTSLAIDQAQVARWIRAYPNAGVGLRTGRLVGFDIDLLDPEQAQVAREIVVRRLGFAPMRVGRAPKLLLAYRTDAPFPQMSLPGVQVLGRGQQFLAYGLHPVTGRPYVWPLGAEPLDTPLDALPRVTAEDCAAALAEISATLDLGARTGSRRAGRQGAGGDGRPTRDPDGRVTDGRDGWLSILAFHAVQDAIDAGRPLDIDALAALVWGRFEATTDLARAKGPGSGLWSETDARRKVFEKLRLHREGALPPRRSEMVAPPDLGALLGRDEARARLDAALAEACATIATWRAAPTETPPRIGLKATVGLGKSVAARRHVDALRRDLAARGLPSRVLWCVPAHGLAMEAAEAWRALGARTAVLRGYEAVDPSTGAPLCRDMDAVRLALQAGQDVQTHACADRKGAACAWLTGCAKQANRIAVAEADVVVAPYDALFTGFASAARELGLVVVDEACWARATTERRGLSLEALPEDLIDLYPKTRIIAALDDAADLHMLRARLAAAFRTCGAGALRRTAVAEAGLTPEDVRLAIVLEKRRLVYVRITPGMGREARKSVGRLAARNARTRLYVALWDAVERLLAGEVETDGRVQLLEPDPRTGLREIVVRGLKPMQDTVAALPVLHLDATLRQALAETILPGLVVTEIAAAAPHQRLRLVVDGPFGKGGLVPAGGLAQAEAARRANNLAACVDYVRWHAARQASGRALVVTYKAIEDAFAAIPGVETAHFNGMAGIDRWRDVALLVVVGRPLPASGDLADLAAALFGHAVDGDYRREAVAVATADGRGLRVGARRHVDPRAEAIRAAICDDEIIQAIGRGRGVNRDACHPLEVHVLADVALPLPHWSVARWDDERPDVLQRMLLEGLAVDSPGDAVALHPRLLTTAEQAEKAFERARFNRHSPIEIPYREMSVKSARYRRGGRGRGWQRAYWIAGDADMAKAALERAVGPLAEWTPE